MWILGLKGIIIIDYFLKEAGQSKKESLHLTFSLLPSSNFCEEASVKKRSGCVWEGEGLKLNHSGLMPQMCLLYEGMSLAEKELTTGSNCSGKQRHRGILKVQLSEIVSLTDTDKKKKAFSVFPQLHPCVCIHFFSL